MGKLNLINDHNLERIFFTLAAIVIGVCVSLFVQKLIHIFFSQVKHRIESPSVLARTRTLRNLFKNIFDVVLAIMLMLIILSKWGVNIIPLLTGAGIFGLAISFGAQTFIKDLISGMFIILEDQFHIGDRVKIDKYEGVVYNITLRLTVLKDSDNNMIYIPNSQITSLVRYNEG